MKERTILIASAIVAIGLAFGGFFISRGMWHFAFQNRSVTVKGLSTKDVNADHVVWPLHYSVVGDDLPTLYHSQAEMQEKFIQFFRNKGFAAEDIQIGSLSVDENTPDYYGHQPEHKYTISSSIVISTDNVDLVRNNQGCQNELLAEGIILSSSQWLLDYQYNGLSLLKPTMIEEATKNARAVGQKFAEDANCKLGSIRNASQGQFSVETDEYCPWIKHVRVVTTIEYDLK